ncbi:MAG: hypothetical protein FWD60_12875 [Candidatus Azobacteroides sp.]|nr:hypothetical protein [Candidatus Azobacteroides sp.]
MNTKNKWLIILGIIFLLSSCKTQKTVENEQEKQFISASKTVSDSTVYRQKSEMKIETVKADTVKLNLNPADVATLPTGASYSQKSGRAVINVRHTDNGNIDITATCDSLSVFYESLTVEYEHYRKVSSDSIDVLNKEIVKIKSQPVVGDTFWAKIKKGAIAITGIVILLFIIKRRFRVS